MMKITESNNPFVVLYQAIWYYSRGFRYYMPIYLTLLLTALVMNQSLPFVMGKIITELQVIVSAKESITKTLVHLLIIYGMLSLTNWAFWGPGRVIERRFALRIKERCYNDLYNRTQSLPLAWHQDHHSGNLMSRISTCIESLYAYTETQFIILRTLIRLIIPVGFLFILAWPLAVTCVITLIIVVPIALKFDKHLLIYFTKRREVGHKISALMFDYIANIQTIITLRLGGHTKKEIAQRVRQQREVAYPEGTLIEWKWATIDTLVNINQIIVIIYMVWLFQKGQFTEIGLIVSVLQYTQSFSGAFFDIGSRYETIQRQANDIRATQAIHDAYEDLPSHTSEEDDHIVSFTQIDVHDMVFAYKDNQIGKLDHVSVSLRKGQKIAFVGSSGSGKSTTMKLLRGLYPLQSGTLIIDGVTQDDFEPLKSVTTLIPQEPEIFENTIRYNITMGVEHDDADILEACRIACFDTVLNQLPHGLDTDIREKGVNLSGGQKQRLALARGVFAIEDSDIILLDEPTSSVDGMTEQRIYDNLLRAFPDKCLVSSIHRLHMLTQFDMIYVFDRGRVVQSGMLKDLLQHEGLFKSMYKAYQNIID
jgi:ATP-binding cassette subfamily B protein